MITGKVVLYLFHSWYNNVESECLNQLSFCQFVLVIFEWFQTISNKSITYNNPIYSVQWKVWALCHHGTQQCLMCRTKTLEDSPVYFVVLVWSNGQSVWSGQWIRVWEWCSTSCSDFQEKRYILHTFLKGW